MKKEFRILIKLHCFSNSPPAFTQAQITKISFFYFCENVLLQYFDVIFKKNKVEGNNAYKALII